MQKIFDIFRTFVHNKQNKNNLCEQVLGDRGAVRFYGGLWKQKKEELEYLDIILKDKVNISMYEFICLCAKECVLYDMEEKKANEEKLLAEKQLEKKALRTKAF